MTRKDQILKSIDITSGVGLELGPLTTPIVSKNESSIYYLDHLSQSELKEKYKHEPVDLDKIAPIDYVLNGTLRNTVKSKKFDYVLASHVIEHLPDIVSWLKDIGAILKPSGVLSLAIPDKRFTFDIHRHVSTPAEVIGAYLDELKKPSAAMIYDFASLYVKDVDTGKALLDAKRHYPKGKLSQRRWTAQEAYGMCMENLRPDGYVDCHCFTFTPASFVEILRALIEQGLLEYEISYFRETQDYQQEFYVSLHKINPQKVGRQRQLASLPKITSRDTEKELTEEVVRLKQEIAALNRSVSWKVTRPLRAIRRTGLRKGK